MTEEFVMPVQEETLLLVMQKRTLSCGRRKNVNPCTYFSCLAVHYKTFTIHNPALQLSRHTYLHLIRKRLLQQFVDLRLALVELQPGADFHAGTIEENKKRKDKEQKQTQSSASGGGKNQIPKDPDEHNNAVHEQQQDVENYENDAARRKRLADFLSPQVLTGFSLFTFAYVGLHLVFPRLGRRFGTVLAALHLSHGLVVREQVFGKTILKTLCVSNANVSGSGRSPCLSCIFCVIHDVCNACPSIAV